MVGKEFICGGRCVLTPNVEFNAGNIAGRFNGESKTLILRPFLVFRCPQNPDLKMGYSITILTPTELIRRAKSGMRIINQALENPSLMLQFRLAEITEDLAQRRCGNIEELRLPLKTRFLPSVW